MGMIHDWRSFRRQLEERKKSIEHQIEMVDWVLRLWDVGRESEANRVQLIEFMRERISDTTAKHDAIHELPGRLTKREGTLFTGPIPAPDNHRYFKDGTEAIRQPYGYQGDKCCVKCGANLRAKGDNHKCAPHVTGDRYECKDCGTMAPRGGFHSCDPKYKQWKCPNCNQLATNKDIHFCGAGDNDPGNNARSFKIKLDVPQPAEKKLKCPECSTYFGGGQAHFCRTGKIFIDKDTDPKCPFCQEDLTDIKSHMCDEGEKLVNDVLGGIFGDVIDKEANEKNFEILDPEDWQGMS